MMDRDFEDQWPSNCSIADEADEVNKAMQFEDMVVSKHEICIRQEGEGQLINTIKRINTIQFHQRKSKFTLDKGKPVLN